MTTSNNSFAAGVDADAQLKAKFSDIHYARPTGKRMLATGAVAAADLAVALSVGIGAAIGAYKAVGWLTNKAVGNINGTDFSVPSTSTTEATS